MHKTKEHEAYFTLLAVLLKHFTVSYVKGRQDGLNNYVDLTIHERMNIEVDAIATSKANPFLLNILLPSVHFAIYVKGECTNINNQKRIRERCFEHDVRKMFAIEISLE